MQLTRLYYYSKLITSQTEGLKSYVEESVRSLKTRQESLDAELKSMLKDVDDDDFSQHIIDGFLDDNLKYHTDFPCYFNESSFLIAYSFFETSLFKICKYASMDVNAAPSKKLSIAAPTGSYIYDSKSFLEKACGISLKGENSTWKKLDKLRDFRNFLAHNNLDLKHTKNSIEKAKKKRTINYLNRVFKKHIVVDRLEKYKIDNHILILEMLKLIESYLLFSINRLQKKYKNYK